MRVIRSIRFRITALATALVAATLLLAAVALLNLVRADLISDAEDSLASALEDQALELEQAYAELALGGEFEDVGAAEVYGLTDFEVAGEAAELGGFEQAVDGLLYGEILQADESLATVVIDPTSGEVLEVIDPGSGEVLDDGEVAAAIDDYQFDVFVPDFYTDDIEALPAEFTEPLLVGATSLDDIQASIDALENALLMTVPLLLAAFAALAWWLVGRALKPVVGISARVSEISSANLGQRVPVPETGDEVSELATVMNRMLGRLQRGDQRQRQFAADASHELRSPLATLRTAAEMIERHADPARSRSLASDIVSEADRMDELISDLLELSRLEEEGDRGPAGDGNREPVDLIKLAEAEAQRAELGGRTAVKVLGGESGPLPVSGSPRQLRRLVANLVDNAGHYAQSAVVVTVRPEDGQAVLTVDDDGPGIPAAKTAEIFERFSRLDEARDRRSGGTGLGLALVKAIVERHDAAISVGESPLGGARFTVQFPAAV